MEVGKTQRAGSGRWQGRVWRSAEIRQSVLEDLRAMVWGLCPEGWDLALVDMTTLPEEDLSGLEKSDVAAGKWRVTLSKDGEADTVTYAKTEEGAWAGMLKALLDGAVFPLT